jgi:hypothetical protein
LFHITEFNISSLLDMTEIIDPTFSEKGEVTSAHYKLFSADICDIPKLDSVIRMAEMDPK